MALFVQVSAYKSSLTLLAEIFRSTYGRNISLKTDILFFPRSIYISYNHRFFSLLATIQLQLFTAAPPPMSLQIQTYCLLLQNMHISTICDIHEIQF